MLRLKYTRMDLSAKQFKLLEEMKWMVTAVFSVLVASFLLRMGYSNNKLILWALKVNFKISVWYFRIQSERDVFTWKLGLSVRS